MMNIRSTIVTLVLCLAFVSMATAQQSKEEMQRKTQDLLKEISNVKQNLEITQKDKKQTLGVLRGIEKRIELRNQVLTSIKGEVYYVEKDIIRTYRDIDTLKQELKLLKVQYAQSIVYAYKNRSNYDFLNFIFSSSNFGDALKRVSYLKTYRSFREQKAGDIARTQQVLENKIASLTGKRQEKSKALQEQSNQMAVLEVEKKEKDQVIAGLKAKENELVATMKKKERERVQIQRAIAAVIKREKDEALRKERELIAKRKAAEDAARKLAAATVKTGQPEAATTATVPKVEPATGPKPLANKTREASVLENTPEGVVTSQKFEENKGNLPWPVDRGEIILRYGNNTIPGKTRSIVVPSDGITIETSIGAPVKAVFDGEVAAVSNMGDRQLVILKHGKYFTTYSNLQGVSVSRGQKINRGQTIGQAASNDEGVGSMDLQMDTEKGTINPEQWIRRR